jgi:hypothetical protein
MTIFKPNSAFGRNALRSIYESQRFSCQLLRVPNDLLPINKDNWTWKDNWSKYITTKPSFLGGAETMYTGADNSLEVDSQPSTVTQNVSIDLYSGTGTTVVGAYYDLPPNNTDPYADMYNDMDSSAVQYTHCAIFINDDNLRRPLKRPENLEPPVAPSLIENLDYFEERFIGTVPYNNNSFPIESVNPQQFLDVYFFKKLRPPEGPFSQKNFGPTFVLDKSFNDLIDTIILERSNLISGDYPTVGLISRGNLPYNATSKIHERIYKRLFLSTEPGVSDLTSPHTVLVELLNVTTTAPADDSPWSDWEEHRIKRYYISSSSGPYRYTPKEIVFVEVIEYYYDEIITITETYSGVEIATENPLELTITPPTSGSFTFTHIAVFSTDRTTPLASGTTYVYPDTDKLIGVVDMEESITVSSTGGVNYTVPLEISYMLGPKYTYEIVFS